MRSTGTTWRAVRWSSGTPSTPPTGDPHRVWSDGVTLWVSDHGAKRLLAYRLPALLDETEGSDEEENDDGTALERVRDEEFTELSRASNNSPRGLWSDGAVMYVADQSDDKVYSYKMPDATEAVVELQKQTGLVAMCGHTRRFNPSHQYVRRKIAAGELSIQHLVAETFFFRRTNTNALGQPRSWTDHLLWHHAAHTVDLFAYQTGGRIDAAHVVQGPVHPELGIAMDMSIQLKASTGALCTLGLSFNNEGPLGTVFRYICDNGTYVARYDNLVDGKETPIDVSKVDVSMNGIELQDREFVAAIREGREPNASVAEVLPCYRTLDQLERQLRQTDAAVTA